MGEPIEPMVCTPDCCYPAIQTGLGGPNDYGWPAGSCGPIEEQWDWWYDHGFMYYADYTGNPPGCKIYCIHYADSIALCACDSFTVHMLLNFICIGQADDASETFGAYKVMVEQGLGPLPNLLNEQNVYGNDEYLGIRDGTKNVRVLFKRDIRVR